MSRIATLNFRMKNTKGNVDGILLYLASTSEDDLWSRKIAISDGRGSCQIPAPGHYALTWYIAGSPGAALVLIVSDGSAEIERLELDDTRIPEGEDENYGILLFGLEA